jgi:hypothetical protein
MPDIRKQTIQELEMQAKRDECLLADNPEQEELFLAVAGVMLVLATSIKYDNETDLRIAVLEYANDRIRKLKKELEDRN